MHPIQRIGLELVIVGVIALLATAYIFASQCGGIDEALIELDQVELDGEHWLHPAVLSALTSIVIGALMIALDAL